MLNPVVILHLLEAEYEQFAIPTTTKQDQCDFREFKNLTYAS